MTILQVIAPAPIGGAESVVLRLSETLAARVGTAVVIAAILADERDHPFVSAARDRGLEVHAVTSGHRRYRAQSREVATLARRVGATVLHTHGFHADVVGAWSGRTVDVPHVSTLHGFTGTGWRDAVYDLAARFVQRRADAMVAVTRAIAETLETRGVAPARIHLIPNAWGPADAPYSRDEARRVLGITHATPRVGWVGRLSAEKDPAMMLEAVARLGGSGPALSFVGEGPERPALEARAVTLGLASRVTFHGAVRDAARLMSAFDVVALSSRTEGAPMTLLEAAAQGVPVVATAVGGIPEMFSDAEVRLAPPADADRFAEALRAALDDRTGTAVRAAAASARVARDYSLPAWAERHAALYASLRRG